MNMNEKIGIITFHAAHNYGSVLQAFATQYLISTIGYDSEIINYRLPNQKEFYNNLYSHKFGSKDFLRRLSRIPEHAKRIKRKEKFERFIQSNYKLSDKEYNTYDELKKIHDKYKVVVTGSDQVWNRHCKAEFMTEPESSILGYYLDWPDENVGRVSFSSSFGGMKREEIAQFAQIISKYNALSVREADGARMLSELLNGRVVENTLDPTLLLERDVWNNMCGNRSYSDDSGYILVYTLRQYNAAKELIEPVKHLAKIHGLKIKVLAPFSLTTDRAVESVIDSGPEDFVALVRDAQLVITDSFHGTAFSINMGTPFYVIEHSKDNRKGLLLKRLGLRARTLSSCNDLTHIVDFCCKYEESHQLLNVERDRSIRWLSSRLGELYAD